MNREDRKNLIALMYALSAVVVVLIVFFLCSARSQTSASYKPTSDNTNNTLAETENFSDYSQEDSVESIAPSIYLGKRISKAYDNVIERYQSLVIDDIQCQCDSFLYDITGDGLPELWLHVGTCEANYKLYIYTYRHGKAAKLYGTTADHATFYQGKDYVIRTMTHMGVNEWCKLTYRNGKIREKKVYHQEVENVDDFVYPQEKIKPLKPCY